MSPMDPVAFPDQIHRAWAGITTPLLRCKGSATSAACGVVLHLTHPVVTAICKECRIRPLDPPNSTGEAVKALRPAIRNQHPRAHARLPESLTGADPGRV